MPEGPKTVIYIFFKTKLELALNVFTKHYLKLIINK